jgi:hypothetical protein
MNTVKTKNMTHSRPFPIHPFRFLKMARGGMFALSVAVLPPASASADEKPGASESGKAAGKKTLEQSRMMTPEEMERSGLTERLRREEEKRQKEVARFLPSFAKLQPMLANIRDGQEPAVFEALPHQVFYPEQHASELGKKETVNRHGFPFYKAPIKLSAEDARKLNSMMKDPDSFGPYLAIDGPGGFQPDFSLVWEADGKPIEVLVCFSNGGEIKAYHDNVFVYCQMAEIEAALKSMLRKYHKQLPELEK